MTHEISNKFDEKFPQVAALMEKRQMEHAFQEALRKQAQRTTLDRVREAMRLHSKLSQLGLGGASLSTDLVKM